MYGRRFLPKLELDSTPVSRLPSQILTFMRKEWSYAQ